MFHCVGGDTKTSLVAFDDGVAKWNCGSVKLNCHQSLFVRTAQSNQLCKHRCSPFFLRLIFQSLCGLFQVPSKPHGRPHPSPFSDPVQSLLSPCTFAHSQSFCSPVSAHLWPFSQSLCSHFFSHFAVPSQPLCGPFSVILQPLSQSHCSHFFGHFKTLKSLFIPFASLSRSAPCSPLTVSLQSLLSSFLAPLQSLSHSLFSSFSDLSLTLHSPLTVPLQLLLSSIASTPSPFLSSVAVSSQPHVEKT